MWPQLLTSVLPGLLDKLFPDPGKASEAKLKLLELQQTGALKELEAQTTLAQGQLAINQEEAKSSNFFVAGWRPSVGWCCSIALMYEFLLRPILIGFGFSQFPDLPMGDLNTLLFGMLGLGALRTVEKVKGAA
jgi:hypothetical protein